MRVCVYGSSSSNTSAKFMEASEELGKQLALGGHVCVNGGGKTGCMGGVNEGCKKHGGKIVGVIHEMFLVDKVSRIHRLLVYSIAGAGLKRACDRRNLRERMRCSWRRETGWRRGSNCLFQGSIPDAVA